MSAPQGTILEIRRPDDWHLHLRDGAALRAVVGDSARRFSRAIVMPNLRPPVRSLEDALAYRERIIAALFRGKNSPDVESPEGKFEPLMTLYLTDNTTPEDIRRAGESPFVHAVKLYPAGATTNSDEGVTDLKKTYPTLAAMREVGLPLLVHAEETAPEIDVFDREKAFLENKLIPLIETFPELKVVFEHITTREAADFVSGAREGVGATITAHHLLCNRNDIFRGGIRPHYYCLPVLKREEDRLALLQAAVSGNPRFFAGTDSAPHARAAKENACGCAGIYTAHAAVELYLEVFDQADRLDRAEDFLSRFGAEFYGLPLNEDRLRLKKESWIAPADLRFGEDSLIPFRAGETISWQLAE